MGFNALKRSALYKPLFLNYYHHMPLLNFWELLAQFSRRFIVSSRFFLVLLYVYVTLQIYWIKLHMPNVAIKGTQ